MVLPLLKRITINHVEWVAAFNDLTVRRASVEGESMTKERRAKFSHLQLLVLRLSDDTHGRCHSLQGSDRLVQLCNDDAAALITPDRSHECLEVWLLLDLFSE